MSPGRRAGSDTWTVCFPRTARTLCSTSSCSPAAAWCICPRSKYHHISVKITTITILSSAGTIWTFIFECRHRSWGEWVWISSNQPWFVTDNAQVYVVVDGFYQVSVITKSPAMDHSLAIPCCRDARRANFTQGHWLQEQDIALQLLFGMVLASYLFWKRSPGTGTLHRWL